MGVSMLFDGIAFYYIYKYKGLQAHPMKLFMWMSLSTFSYFWLLFWQSFVCDYGLDNLFNATVYFDPDANKWSSLKVFLHVVPF